MTGRCYRARWVVPIDQPPIEGGWVRIEGGVIRDVGAGVPDGPADDLGDAAILPGLINAHTHLELSWLAGRVPPAESMVSWIRTMMAARREAPNLEDQRAAASDALATARAQGTIAFGDISNTLVSVAPLVEAQVPSVVFHEVLGFLPAGADERASRAADAVADAVGPPVVAGLAPHAPFSTSPELFTAVAREVKARRMSTSVHLGESPEEVELLRSGSGPFRELLQDLGVWNDQWQTPACEPVAYLDGLGALTPGLLVVHCTQLDRRALATIAERGAVIVSCPRSNRWTGVGDPALDDFYASGAVVALGTDSLTSAPSLDMFDELAASRRVSTVGDSVLLESATRSGARALGLDAAYGRIASGLRAPLLAVDVPAGIADVQEYLVAGRPESRRWIGV